MADTFPPMTQQGSPQLVLPPEPSTNEQNFDTNSDNKNVVLLSQYQLWYDHVKEQHRALITMPLDVTLAAWDVVSLPNDGPEFAGNWIIESHILRLGDGFALSELELRKCVSDAQAIAAGVSLLDVS